MNTNKTAFFILFSLLFLSGSLVTCYGQQVSFSQQISEPYPHATGSYSGKSIPESPDPLVNYRWEETSADDGLETYNLSPASITADIPENMKMDGGVKESIQIKGPCNVMIDFGRESAGWLEFDADNFQGEVEMSISEYNEPAIVNKGAQNPKKTLKPIRYGSTYRLELNHELYEGVRFGWIHIKSISKPFTIKNIRLVCQVKPTNYEGSFSSSDTTLNRIWYTGAYTVKLNFQKDFFGAILMERSDRFSWTGDAYPAQAASLVAFGNYDFIRKNISHTSTQSNNIASYSLYWVLSLVDYCNYTGDTATLRRLLPNACEKLEHAYARYDEATNLGFNGWDERLGAGFENADCTESQFVYKTLCLEAWNKFGELMQKLDRADLSTKYASYVIEKMKAIRQSGQWLAALGIHAAANLVNAGVLDEEEKVFLWKNVFSDRQQRLSYSPFNQYYIIEAMAKMNRFDEALTTIDDCWGGQLREGATSFFEVYRPSWNTGIGQHGAPVNNQCGYTSLCHPWSAGVTKWMSEQLLGIRPTSPGFATFVVLPQLPNHIDQLAGAVPTPKGVISLAYDAAKGKMELEVPDHTQAMVGIPKNRIKNAQVNINGKSISFDREDDQYFYLENLNAGNYHIRVIPVQKKQKVAEEPFRYQYAPAREDSITNGNWENKYGSKGYIFYNYDSIHGHRKNMPDFIDSVHISLNSDTSYQSASKDFRALRAEKDNSLKLGSVFTQDPLACLQTMTFDVHCNKDQPYQVALYMVDWQQEGRRSAIEVFDLDGKKLLMPVKIVQDYRKGKYILIQSDQSIRIRVNQIRGSNAALSALFFD